MSLIHRALDQPELPPGSQASGYNPLGRPPPATNRLWWWITAVAVVASLAVLGLRWLEPRVPELPFGTAADPEPVAPAESGTSPSVPAASGPATEAARPIPTLEPDRETRPETPALADAPAPSEPEPARQPEPTGDAPPQTEPDPAPAPAADDPPEATATQPADSEATTTPAPRDSSPEPGAPPPAEPAARTAGPETGSVRIAGAQRQDRQRAVEAALDSDQVERAETLLRDWIRQSPDESLPRLWLAKIYLSNQRYTAADALLEGETDVEALGLRGLVLEKTARYNEAVRIYEHLTRREPDNPRWWLHWAINQENSGQLAQARDLYQTYLEQFSAYNTRLTAFARQRYQALEGN